MHIQQLEFLSDGRKTLNEVSELAFEYLCSLRMNGQICGKEWPLYFDGNRCIAIVLMPEQDSLDSRFNSRYVTDRLAKLSDGGVVITSHSIGDDIRSAERCTCTNRSGYVLYTSYVSLESPVKCLDCFAPIPLYELPVLASGEYYEIICWQSDFQCCDSLQMNCATLERSATRQISELDSSLSVAGRKLCTTLSELSGKPFYYYLYRAHGRGLASEKKRVCPSCGEYWYIPERLHSIFHFKCDHCRLLSNLAWNISANSPDGT